MDEETIYKFKSYSRLFPSVAFATHTSQVGSTTVCSGATLPSSSVKVLALLCTKSKAAIPKRKRQRGEGNDTQPNTAGEAPLQGTSAENASHRKEDDAGTTSQDPATRRLRTLYVRAQYDETIIETLPLELFRERHPQVLLDYLLSCSCWS